MLAEDFLRKKRADSRRENWRHGVADLPDRMARRAGKSPAVGKALHSRRFARRDFARDLGALNDQAEPRRQ